MAQFFNKRRISNALNAGSMADIAFLLLIFFLVTTTIMEDQGVLVKLPMLQDDIVSTQISDRNVLSVLVNADDELLVEGEIMQVEQLQKRVVEFITNPHQDDHLASNPRKAVISLMNDRETTYDSYLAVYDALKSAYAEIWASVAERDFKKSYDQLTKKELISIKMQYPLVISEAESKKHRLD